MKFRVLALLISASLVVPQQIPAQPPPAPQSAQAPPFFLTNASLLEVIDILCKTLKISYILDAKVKGGSVTINTYGEMKVSDLRPILETILRMNGLAMVQVGNLYRIVQVADSTRLPIHPQANMKDFPDDESMLLNMIFLKLHDRHGDVRHPQTVSWRERLDCYLRAGKPADSPGQLPQYEAHYGTGQSVRQ